MRLENVAVKENEKPKFIMLVGLPGSGKSTYIKKVLSKNSDFVILSTDDYIEQKAREENSTYSEVFQKNIKEATRNMNNELQSAVKEHKNIIWDQTNLTANSRKKKLANIPDIYSKEAIVFKISDNELLKRLEKRKEEEGKEIPSHVLKNMKNSFEMPTEDEGFNEVRLI